MSTKVNICNLALSHLGVAKEISIFTEKSAEAGACRRYYDLCRDKILRAFRWPFASKCIALALVEADPTSEWSYSYAYPTDCLDIQRIISGLSIDSADSRIKYKIVHSTAGRLIYTDQPNAEAEYTVRVTDTSLHTADFDMSFSYLLAFYIAPRLIVGDPFKLGPQALQNFALEITQAEANAANEEYLGKQSRSELVNFRN